MLRHVLPRPMFLAALVVMGSSPRVVIAQQPETGARYFGRASLGLPLIASVSAARVVVPVHSKWGPTSGYYVGAELGALGVGANLGRVTPGDMGATLLQVGVLQSWQHGMNTYVGGEGRVMPLGLSLGLGVYRRVAGTRGREWMPVATFGFGY